MVSDVADRTRRIPLEVKVSKETTRNFSAFSLTITGEMSLRVPGREVYEGIKGVNITYTELLQVEIKGLLRDVGNGVEVEEGRLEAIGLRADPTITALNLKKPEIGYDPEITIFRGGESVVLNQVIGLPVVCITKGFVTYR